MEKGLELKASAAVQRIYFRNKCFWITPFHYLLNSMMLSCVLTFSYHSFFLLFICFVCKRCLHLDTIGSEEPSSLVFWDKLKMDDSSALSDSCTFGFNSYCSATNIPYVEHFTAFSSGTDLFKHDQLHPNHAGCRLLSETAELTRSCRAFTVWRYDRKNASCPPLTVSASVFDLQKHHQLIYCTS